MPDKIIRVVVPELNEVKLVSDIAKRCTGWVQDIRFTVERKSAKNITDEDKSYTPKVYKYYIPKHEVNSEPIGVRNANGIDDANEVVPKFPMVLVRPSTTNIDLDERGDYEEVNIDIIVYVSEYDVDDRYNFLLLAKKILVQGLRSIEGGIVLFGYQLNKSISSSLFDDENNPKAGIVITTKWRCALPPQRSKSLDQI